MLDRSSVLGKNIPPATAKGLLMLTIFEQRTCGYGADFDCLYLTFGDLTEFLARCGREYLKHLNSVMTLAEQLLAMAEHIHRTVSTNGQLQPLEVKTKKGLPGGPSGGAAAAPAPARGTISTPVLSLFSRALALCTHRGTVSRRAQTSRPTPRHHVTNGE